MTRGSSSSSGSSGGRPPGSQPGSLTPTGFIDRYQILEKIGDGGMGSLYLARDPAIDRLLAIKLLRRGYDTEALRERFAREARAAGRLRHPNIVTIFDVGEHDGDPFIAMEFLAGETLAELVRAGARLSIPRRLKLIEEMCDGLAYAHRAGLVHRDVKPANLMVDADGVLKILDFGIVRLDDSGITQAGVLVGTINYMSPEQVLGTGVDHRSDIFAVGLVAYELLSGHQAFPGTLKTGLLHRIPNVQIQPLAQVVPGLDAEVVSIVELALRKDPEDRYQDLARMRNDLARVRLRISAEEERAASAAVAQAGETEFIPRDRPVAELRPTPPPSPPALMEEAERALSEGNFRFALTIAGRTAALNPEDGAASGIVARAEAGLLERGRSFDTASGIARGLGSAAPSAGGRSGVGSGAGSGAGSGVGSGSHLQLPPTAAGSRWNQVTLALAILALAIAGVAVWRQVGTSPTGPTASDGPASERQSAPSTDPPASVPAPPAAPSAPSTPEVEPVEPPVGSIGRGARSERPQQTPAERGGRGETRQPENRRERPRPDPVPSNPPRSAPPEVREPAPTPPLRPTTVRVGAGVDAPRRVRYAEPVYPRAAEEKGLEGTVGIEITISREGHVADTRVVNSIPGLDEAAVAAVRQWQYAPTLVDGQAVAVIHTVDVRFTAPEKPKPAPPPATPPPPAPKPAEPPKTAAAPPRDPAAEAIAAVKDVLRRYEAAWESLNFEALASVQVLSRAEADSVRGSMADTESYQMDITTEEINVDPSAERAVVSCTIARRFQPRIGSRRQETTRRHTIVLEKRDGRWMITSLVS